MSNEQRTFRVSVPEPLQLTVPASPPRPTVTSSLTSVNDEPVVVHPASPSHTVSHPPTPEPLQSLPGDTTDESTDGEGSKSTSDIEPTRRIVFYKEKDDKGDFCIFTLTCQTPPDFPTTTTTTDIGTREIADLFVHVKPDTTDVLMWMRDMHRTWIPVQEGAIHPTMPYRCLYVKRVNGSVDVNWVLQETVRTYQQRALRDSRLREVSASHHLLDVLS